MKINLILLFLLITGCAQSTGESGTTTGDPLTDVSFEPYSPSIAQSIRKLIIKDAFAGVNDLSFCFKRIRFKDSDADLGSNVDLELGEVVINEEGTPLGQVQIAEGIYRRVEFDLEKNCDGTNKPSISLINDNGSFSSEDRITIRFSGEFNPAQDDLNMFIQNFINVLKNYTLSDGSLKDVLEDIEGTY